MGAEQLAAELIETAAWLDEQAAELERIAGTGSLARLREAVRLTAVKMKGRAGLIRLVAVNGAVTSGGAT